MADIESLRRLLDDERELCAWFRDRAVKAEAEVALTTARREARP